MDRGLQLTEYGQTDSLMLTQVSQPRSVISVTGLAHMIIEQASFSDYDSQQLSANSSTDTNQLLPLQSSVTVIMYYQVLHYVSYFPCVKNQRESPKRVECHIIHQLRDSCYYPASLRDLKSKMENKKKRRMEIKKKKETEPFESLDR